MRQPPNPIGRGGTPPVQRASRERQKARKDIKLAFCSSNKKSPLALHVQTGRSKGCLVEQGCSFGKPLYSQRLWAIYPVARVKPARDNHRAVTGQRTGRSSSPLELSE